MILVLLLLNPGAAFAVSLGNIEVTSHLGEPFFAEVPIRLEKKESINNVFVELANPADYRILEIYRNPAINAIRVDIVNDSRGQRVELSSDSAIRTPYFSLVLKLRYGRATHFKKYPVVLDLPRTQTKVGQPIPETLPWKTSGQEGKTEVAGKPDSAVESGAGDGSGEFKPFDGWARTSRYGPMVAGDTISVVARRLRIDERYTLPQVMVAIFEKNKDKFDQGNINLIEKGVFLDVPTAREVEAISPAEARRILDEHEKRWRELRKKPEYEAIAEAQKYRYSRRIRIGGKTEELATGVAPVVEEIKQPPEARHETARQGSEQTPAVPEPEVVAEIALLQQRNAELEERLAKTEEKLQAIEARINAPQPQPSAAGDRLGDLEKQLSRLQAELGRTLSQAQGALAPVGSPLGTSGMTNLLAGSIVLLLIAILFLLRRQRAYIASLNKLAEGESSDQVEKRPEPGHVDDDLPEGVRTSKGIDEVATTQSSVEKPAEREVTAQPGERNIDPNMDYLGEAEVYLRYGMEDEAIENIRLAILQHPDNVEAHCKLIRLLAGKGDREALDLAIAAGRKALAGSARERFEDEVAQALGGGESPSETEASEPLKAAEGRDETVVSGTGVQEDGAEEISFVSETREDESLSDLGEIEWASLEEVTDAGEEQGVVDSYDELIKKESGSEPAPSQDLEEFDFELESPGEAEESRASVLPQTEPETTEEPATDQPQGGSGQSPLDLGPEPLLIDTGRSLLAAGSLDEAERLFRQALGGNQHGLALLGLAEIAKKRGDEESARSLLAQAEPLLDEASRDWFNRLTS